MMPNKAANRLAVGVCAFFFACYCLACFWPPINSLSAVASIFAIVGISFSALLTRQDNVPASPSVEKSPDTKWIDRSNQLDALANAVLDRGPILVVSGDSGCGKTHLVRTYCSMIKRGNEGNAEYLSGNYFLNISDSDLKGCTHVVFDQFERAMVLGNIASQVAAIKGLAGQGIRVLIVVRSEYVGKCAQLFGNQVGLHFVENDSIDERGVVTSFQEIVKATEEQVRANPVLNQLISDFSSNDLRFVQLDFLSKLMRARSVAVLEKYLSDGAGNRFDYHTAFSDYLKLLLEGHRYSRTAAVALYMLSLKGTEGLFSIYDFQNVALENAENVKETLTWLESVQLVEKRQNVDGCSDGPYARYSLPHDYYCSFLQDVCKELVDSRVRENVDCYVLNRNHVAESDEMRFVDTVHDRYLRCFESRRAHRIMRALLGLLLAFIMVANLVLLLVVGTTLVDDPTAVLERAIIQMLVAASIVYMYNLFYFLVGEVRFGYFAVACGFVACVVSVLFPGYCGIVFGLGVMSVALVMLVISTRCGVPGRKGFQRRFRVYGSTGLLITALGVFYALCMRGSFIQMFPFFLLYGVFIVLCMRSHLEPESLRAQVGELICSEEMRSASQN